MNLDVIIRITPDCKVWVETLGPTKVPLKQVDIRDLANAFLEFCSTEIQTMDLELPEGCIYCSFDYNPSSITAINVILFRPAHVRNITYYQDIYNVPIPACLYRYTLSDNRIINTHVATCTLDDPGLFDNDTVLYRFPYGGNVYPGGHICYGCNKLPNIESPKQLSGMPEYFLQLPFGEGSREPIANMSGKDSYPDELLVPYTNYGRFKTN